ncbi:pentatricopeptide repeat-containing protein, partial [Clarias magur]
ASGLSILGNGIFSIWIYAFCDAPDCHRLSVIYDPVHINGVMDRAVESEQRAVHLQIAVVL